MKKFITALLMSFTIFTVAACTEKTEFGECVGVMEQEQPGLIYKPSGWNIFVAFIFSETIVVPAIVIMDDLTCPVARDTTSSSVK